METPTSETPVTEVQCQTVARLLYALIRHLSPQDDQLIRELPVAQLRVCVSLCDGQRAMSTLSRELGVSLSAMTQLADRLERAELVSRVAEEGDRRVRCLQLTERGAKIVRHREESRLHRVAAVLNKLPPPQRSAAITALESLWAAALSAGNGNNTAQPKAKVSS